MARRWLFRLVAAVGLPTALLVGLEASLRLAGVGQSPHFLIPDAKPGYLRTNPDYLALFMPRNFDLRPLHFRVALVKPPNTVRVVVLGESAAQGVPEPAFGFAPQLRALLRARYPGRNVEVINTGIVAINSHVIYRIAQDLTQISPDLFVVYMGNNEVVGPYGPGCAYLSATPPLWLIRTSIFVRTTRVGQLATAGLEWLGSRRRRSTDWGGMSMFVNNGVTGDDPRLERVYRNFEANLRGIVRVATAGHAKTILCTVVANLKDCAPFLSRHRAGITAAELATWREAFDRGELEWMLGENRAAWAELSRALALDPQYADTSFMLGEIALHSDDVASARKLFIAAEHWDALRFRPDPRINAIIRGIAQENPASIRLTDTALALGADSESSAIPTGRELLFEHVHFNWAGNYAVARLLADNAEVLLEPSQRPKSDWLSSAACADALAYTPHEIYSVWLRNWDVVQAPPFTNQLTYPDDQARLARELAAAQARGAEPETCRRAKRVVTAAIAADITNPTLWKIAEGLDDDLGDVLGAIDDIRHQEQLQPDNFALFTDEAIKLARLGEYSKAEQLLQHTARNCAPRDLALMAPAFVDLYQRTNRPAEALRFVDAAVTRRPHDVKLALLHAQVERSAGDNKAAESDYRRALELSPGSQEALEGLVTLLRDMGKTAAVEEETLGATDRQPSNHTNNLRAALIAEAHGDDADAIRYLLAAEHSGAITSGVELRLARKLLAANRHDEALLPLARAARLARIEGDTGTANQIVEVIAKLRSAH